MREVVYNAMDLHGKVFTVKIPFVVCEVRRPLLSMAMLEDKGFSFDSQKMAARNWEAVVVRSIFEDRETPILLM